MDAKTEAPKNELKTKRVTLGRRPQRGLYDFEDVQKILDQTFLCHIGFAVDGQPYVIPTSFGRAGRRIYVHGSSASRMQRHVGGGFPICVTVSIFDALVLARSAFNHSMNYRSVVILGTAKSVEGDEKLHALEVMAEHMLPGRWKDIRGPNETEMLATAVFSIEITEASAKIRQGPPLDDDEDMDRECWAGEIPIVSKMLSPITDPRSPKPFPIPENVRLARGLKAWSE
jgi:nitroimidazol reductase NimA-like FMN-containing flavoprotein (pyridoxamine 5'-phosphate oxidase superfamily)